MVNQDQRERTLNSSNIIKYKVKVKMKTYIKISVITFSSIFFLCNCGSGLNTVSIDSDKPIKFENYSIHSPFGDDWEYQPNEVTKSVMFYRQSGEMWQLVSKRRRDTFIKVFRNYTTMPTKNINKQEFASSYMDSEFRLMEESAEKTGYGKPYLIARDKVLTSEKTLYRMNYGLNMCLLPGSGWTAYPGQGHLYIYLPESFEGNGIFYLFLIEEYGGEDFINADYDFDQINNVLATFMCDED
jgi:hypothetical protein